TTLVVSGFPSPITAGVAGSVTVTAKDIYGNPASNYTGTVALTSSDGQAVLHANNTFTSGDDGTFCFSATLKTAAMQSVTATDAANSLAAMQPGITVNPAAVSTLLVIGFPSPIVAGSAGSLTVTAKDPYGNANPTYTGSVALTSSDSQAV